MLISAFMGVYVVIASLNAAIGCYVFYKNPKSSMHRAFFVVAIGIVGWMLGVVFLVATGRFFFVAPVLWSCELSVIGFMVFSQTFPGGRALQAPFVAWLPWILIFACTPFHWFIADFALNARGFLEPRNGSLFSVLAIVMASYVFASFHRLSRTWRESYGIRRVQMRYFLLGSGTFLAFAFLCDAALPSFGIFYLDLIGPISSIVFVGCTAYAIIQYEFLDIRVIIKRSAAYFAAIAVVAVIFFTFEFTVEKFFYNDEIVDIVAAMVGAATFFRFRTVFEKLTDRIFFRADYDYAEAVRDLGPVLNSTIELAALITAIDGFLAQTIKPAKTIFIAGCAATPFFFVHRGSPDEMESGIAPYCELITAEAPPAQEVLIVQEAELRKLSSSSRAYSRIVEKYGFSAVVPFVAKDLVVGTLFLGQKLSDDILRQKDIGLLSVLSHQGGIAIENARLYESIRRSNEELEDIVAERTREIKEMYRTQEQFMMDISHQLQTPIAILEGNLELIEKCSLGQMRHPLHAIRDTLDGMAYLVANFLETARLNFSKNKFHHERFDVGELLQETYEDCLVLAETKCVRMHCSAANAVIAGDRRKIKEVILNLVSNALKHTQSQGILAIEGAKPGTCAEIIVRDTGAGISPDNLAHIFERFYRIPGTGVHGTGLGLNICREIIEMHGGTISAESTVGEGSVFRVCLPLASESDAVASGIL